MSSQFRSRIRLLALLLLVAGYGWAGGRFIPASSPLVAYIFQLGILAILMSLACIFLGRSSRTSPSRWPSVCLTIFAVLTLLINIVNILHGVTGFGPQNLGSNGSFADLLPISLIVLGDIMWLGCLFAKSE